MLGPSRLLETMKHPRKIIAIDPSSKCTGYAVLDGPCKIIDAGLLKPRRQSHPAIIRIGDMVNDALGIIAEHDLKGGVVEITEGKVSRRHGTGGGAGLAVYGMAVGAFWWAMHSALGMCIATTENNWTHGVTKARRAVVVRGMFPTYRSIDDPGLDVADAIGLGLWFFDSVCAPGWIGIDSPVMVRGG